MLLSFVSVTTKELYLNNQKYTFQKFPKLRDKIGKEDKKL